MMICGDLPPNFISTSGLSGCRATQRSPLLMLQRLHIPGLRYFL